VVYLNGARRTNRVFGNKLLKDFSLSYVPAGVEPWTEIVRRTEFFCGPHGDESSHAHP
jgi:hypothetical protein